MVAPSSDNTDTLNGNFTINIRIAQAVRHAKQNAKFVKPTAWKCGLLLGVGRIAAERLV